MIRLFFGASLVVQHNNRCRGEEHAKSNSTGNASLLQVAKFLTSLCCSNQGSPLQVAFQPSCMACWQLLLPQMLLHVRANTLHVMHLHKWQPAEHTKHIRSSEHLAHQTTGRAY